MTAETIYNNLTQLGSTSGLPASPDQAVLERVSNPQKGISYLVRFTAPEFTSLCPITGQPDFAHLVIDYVPGDWLVESKSLKLYLGSFRNHGAFHEDCTIGIAPPIDRIPCTAVAADRRLLVSAGRHANRRLLPDRRNPARSLGPGAGGGAIQRPWLSRGPPHRCRVNRYFPSSASRRQRLARLWACRVGSGCL